MARFHSGGYELEALQATLSLTNIKEQQAKNADLAITVNRTDLETVMGGKATFDDLLKSGKAKFDGDRKPFDQLRGMLVQFDPIFEILPGTMAAKPAAKPAKDPFEQENCQYSLQLTS